MFKIKIPVFSQLKFSEKFATALKVAKEHHETFYTTDYTYYCPYCGSPLMPTQRMEKLETLDEHVTCSEPLSKTVYKCSSNCEESQYTKWNYLGDSYLDYPEGDYDFDEMREKRHEYNSHLPNNVASAIGSVPFTSDLDHIIPNKEVCLLTYPWNKSKKLYLIKCYKFDRFGHIKSCHGLFEIRIYNKNGRSYRFDYCWIDKALDFFRKIKNNHKNVMKNMTERSIKQLYGYHNSRWQAKKWNFVENIWYSKLVPLIYGNIFGIVYEVDKNKGEYVKE